MEIQDMTRDELEDKLTSLEHDLKLILDSVGRYSDAVSSSDIKLHFLFKEQQAFTERLIERVLIQLRNREMEE